MLLSLVHAHCQRYHGAYQSNASLGLMRWIIIIAILFSCEPLFVHFHWASKHLAGNMKGGKGELQLSEAMGVAIERTCFGAKCRCSFATFRSSECHTVHTTFAH